MRGKFMFYSGFFILVVLALIIHPIVYYSTDDTVIATVTDKERIVESNGEKVSSKYLIFTDKETFENSDLFLVGKFNSSDLQGQLKEGETYQFKVYGWRIGFLSMYRNIESATPIDSK